MSIRREAYSLIEQGIEAYQLSINGICLTNQQQERLIELKKFIECLSKQEEELPWKQNT